MFVKKDADKKLTPKASKHVNTVSTIAEGTTINGDLESDTCLRVDGNIIGNVICKAKIVLGESGIIQGDIQAANADIFGTVNGNIMSDDLTCMKARSTVNGNLHTKRLQIEPDAIFNGQCTMTDDAKPSEQLHKQNESKLQMSLQEN